MKPQSFTEGFSVFSNRVSFNGNNRGFVSCLVYSRVLVLSLFEELDEEGEIL